MDKGIISTANELVTFKNSQGQEVRGTILKLSHSIIIFEVYNPYSIVQLSEVLIGLKVVRANKEIYNGDAVVVNIVNTGMVLIVSATLNVRSWKRNFNLRSKSDLCEEVSFLVDSYEQEQKIEVDFKLCVLSIKSFLSNIRGWFDRLEPEFERSNIECNGEFFLNNFTGLFDVLSKLQSNFSLMSSTINKDLIELYRNFVQVNLHPFLLSSPFLNRTFTKPLGFAGDYMMMHMIQRDNAEGESLFARFVNVFACRIPIMYSVNNRTRKLMKLIEEGVAIAEKEGREYHALSIGCGPALEVKRFIENNNPKVKCTFKLLDFNQETLDFASSEARNAVDGKNIEILTQLDSVHSLLKKSVNKDIEKQRYDIVYCSGLFDYLTDKTCSKLIKMFFEMLKDKGKVFATNMHSKDLDHCSLELLLEWYLIYRDEKDMANFAPKLGKQDIYTDSTGINLCLEINKE